METTLVSADEKYITLRLKPRGTSGLRILEHLHNASPKERKNGCWFAVVTDKNMANGDIYELVLSLPRHSEE